MLQVVLQIVEFLKPAEINSDSFQEKLVHQYLFSFLFMCALTSISTNAFGRPISCIADGNQAFVHSYCFHQGSYISLDDKEFMDETSVSRPLNKSLPDPIRDLMQGKVPDDSRWEWQLIYSIMPWVYFIMACTCKIGRIAWNHLQGNTLSQLIRDLKNPKLLEEELLAMISMSANRFISDIRQHREFAKRYMFVCCLNLSMLTLQLCIVYYQFAKTDLFLGYTLWSFIGYEYIHWPPMLKRAFPRDVHCLITTFGVGGNINLKDAKCVLNHNKFHALFFGILYWSLLVTWICTLYRLLVTLFFCIFKCERCRVIRNILLLATASKTGTLIQKLDYGSAFVLTLLPINLPADIIVRVLEEMQPEFDTNYAAIEARLAGFPTSVY